MPMGLHSQPVPTVPDVSRCCVVKLGGGLITSFASAGKPVPRLNRKLVIARAREIRELNVPVIVLHGTGTFGKPPALKYGYINGRLGRERCDVVAEVASHLAQLEADVLACLQEAGLHPFRLPLVSLVDGTGIEVAPAGVALVRDSFARGMTPVIGGNFAFDKDGFTVCSSDSIAVDLAIAMSAEALLLATGTHGVYRDFGRSDIIFSSLSRSDVATIDAIDAAVHDVSGGMRKKIVTGLRAAQRGIPTFIVDGRIPGNLAKALLGTPLSGTRLCADAAGLPG